MEITEFLLARIAEDEEALRRYVERLARENSATMEPRWSISRLLAECEAKRRIVGMFADAARQHQCNIDELFFGDAPLLLALPYADHEDYQQDWKP